MFKGSRLAVPLAVLAAAFVMTACGQPTVGLPGPAGVSVPRSGSDGGSGSDGMAIDGESVTVNGEDGEDGGTSVGQSQSSTGADGSSPTEVTTEEIAGVGRLEVSAVTGSISVTGTDASTVTLTRNIYRNGDQPDETVRHDGDLLHIESSCWGSNGPPCEIDYELSVPRGVAVTVETTNGDLFTSGLTGSQSVITKNGSVRLTGAGGEQTVAESINGDVEVQMLNPPVRLQATSITGDVTVLVPDSGPYRVESDTAVGDAEIGVRTDPAASSTIAVETKTGDITVGTG